MEKELSVYKKQLADEEADKLRVKESFTELMKNEARHAEALGNELRLLKQEKEHQAKELSRATKEGTDESTARLRKEMKSLKEDYKALKKQYKADQLKSDRDAKRKDESIKFFQDEMVRLKKEAAGPQKSKSKRSGDAEQRIAHLEDEVDHWRSQNIVLEDEIDR